MDSAFSRITPCKLLGTASSKCQLLSRFQFGTVSLSGNKKEYTIVCAKSKDKSNRKKLRKNLRYPRREKLPPELGTNLFLKKTMPGSEPSQWESAEDEFDGGEEVDNDVIWEPDEVEAISSLFKGRIPQKPGNLDRERPLPLPVPHKLRPPGLPTPKKNVKLGSASVVAPRTSVLKQVYRNPAFLVGLAREIRSLSLEEDVSVVLDKWACFLRKGSLSLTIRELGHMDLPERALQTFCWAKKHAHLFPDDRVLASTVEVLARNHELKVPMKSGKFPSLENASRGVIEAMARGFIKGGSLNLSLKLLLAAKDANRMLDPGVYAKLILELGKNPDKNTIVESLLDELGEREDLNLSQQDCTAIMKVCVRLRKFDIVETLFSWFKQSGRDISVTMYTTVIHSRYLEKKYREALAVVWDMEASGCLFDLPAYRVVIKLFVALNDLPRAVRYFSKLKEAGFSPTYDLYQSLIEIYLASGRIAKCKEVCKEAEMAGYKLDCGMTLQPSQAKDGNEGFK